MWLHGVCSLLLWKLDSCPPRNWLIGAPSFLRFTFLGIGSQGLEKDIPGCKTDKSLRRFISQRSWEIIYSFKFSKINILRKERSGAYLQKETWKFNPAQRNQAISDKRNCSDLYNNLSFFFSFFSCSDNCLQSRRNCSFALAHYRDVQVSLIPV